mmetsp:Transcript_2602/g.6015  ORF Transcript_2602/g.6015 Transcript_2602/m.6015 type:complete len:215 (-) Transcript_2602:379-1023(-)
MAIDNQENFAGKVITVSFVPCGARTGSSNPPRHPRSMYAATLRCVKKCFAATAYAMSSALLGLFSRSDSSSTCRERASEGDISIAPYAQFSTVSPNETSLYTSSDCDSSLRQMAVPSSAMCTGRSQCDHTFFAKLQFPWNMSHRKMSCARVSGNMCSEYASTLFTAWKVDWRDSTNTLCRAVYDSFCLISRFAAMRRLNCSCLLSSERWGAVLR